MPHIKKSYFVTTDATDFLPLTHDINAALKEANAIAGVVHVVVPKSGAGLLIFKNSQELRDQVSKELNPVLLPRSVALPVVDGAIVLGHYEEVILVDCEPKSQRREVIFAVTAEAAKEEQ